jgi:hypothetical protein
MQSRIRYYSDIHISLGRLWWQIPLRNNQGADEPIQSDTSTTHFGVFQFCSVFIYVLRLFDIFLNVIYDFVVLIGIYFDVFSYNFRLFDVVFKLNSDFSFFYYDL